MKVFFYLLALITTASFAHVGHMAGDAGFLSGFLHPILGTDHLLAMLAVGLWAGSLPGKSWWLMPLTFVIAMVIAGILGMVLPFSLPLMEPMILSSVLVFGVFIALAWRLPLWVLLPIVAIFSVFHGYAHGAELPEAAQPALYVLGYLSGTTLLLGLGVAVGFTLQKLHQLAPRALGGGIAAAGAWLAFQG
jgi:urease accessory protein